MIEIDAITKEVLMIEISKVQKFGETRSTKHYIQVADKSKKKALIMKNSVHLEDSDKKYGDKMRVFTKEEIEKRHMGKIKCVVKFKEEQEVLKILELYFS
jgi:hypothetical protein